MPPSLDLACTATAAATTTATDEWESVFVAGEASPGPDQYWLMGGDVDDPACLNKVLQCDLDFNANATAENLVPAIDPSVSSSGFKPWQNFMFAPMSTAINLNNNQMQQQQMLPFIDHPIMFGPHHHHQHQVHHPDNQSFSLQGQSINEVVPQAKRHNPGPIQGFPQQQGVGDQGQSFSQQQQQQQAIIDQLYKAAELLQTGNLAVAQGILARLNHHLSPLGKPFLRAAFYFKEALLQLLLHTTNNNNNSNNHIINHSSSSSPFISLVFKIGAYKSLSEISPVLQFANFTCNQAMLEALEGFDRIHVIDFEIGYGGQWASFMQELSLRSGGAPSSLRITAFASPSTHDDQLELTLIRENLIQFATEINMALEFDILSIDSLSWSLHHHISENEAIGVNLPMSSFSNWQQISLALVLEMVKQLSPKVVVSVDRTGCDRNDLPFPNHLIHALHTYSNLMESLEAVNVNVDAVQKIERFLIQPEIEKIITSRHHRLIPDKTTSQHWRTLFVSSGFSPLTFSNLTETQAECVVKRTPVRGFHVEKRQSSLVLCWQRKQLVSASAWRC